MTIQRLEHVGIVIGSATSAPGRDHRRAGGTTWPFLSQPANQRRLPPDIRALAYHSSSEPHGPVLPPKEAKAYSAQAAPAARAVLFRRAEGDLQHCDLLYWFHRRPGTTRSLPRPEGADVRFASGKVTDHFPAISTAAGERAIWVVGGGDLAGQFHDAGLLDEIRLTVAPVALDGGAPLLPRTIRAQHLALTGARRAGAFAELTYAVRR